MLSNLKDDESTNMSTENVEIPNSSNYLQTRRRNQLVKSVGKSKHKVLIIGDSHAKKCAAELQHNLDLRYEVSGFIKPGPTTSEIIKTAKDEISTLKCNDDVILWGGSNDISRNNTKEARRNLSNFMNADKKVNIVLINSPHIHDLLLSSCVSNEVVKINRQLKKIVKLHANVELLEVELQRKHFTRHGQHLNYSGKELVSLELANIIPQLLNKVNTAPIHIIWKDDNLDDVNLDIRSKIAKPMGLCTNEDSPKSSNCDVDRTKGDNKTKVSVRPRKMPVTRSKDFLW